MGLIEKNGIFMEMCTFVKNKRIKFNPNVTERQAELLILTIKNRRLTQPALTLLARRLYLDANIS